MGFRAIARGVYIQQAIQGSVSKPRHSGRCFCGSIKFTVTGPEKYDPSAFSPRSHIWVEDKLPWVTINDGLPQYEKNAG